MLFSQDFTFDLSLERKCSRVNSSDLRVDRVIAQRQAPTRDILTMPGDSDVVKRSYGVHRSSQHGFQAMVERAARATGFDMKISLAAAQLQLQTSE